MTTATTTAGPVEGSAHGSLLRFAGIPFAAPTTGDRRFRPPEPVEPWTEVRDATAFGATSIQGPSPIAALFGEEPEPVDEDCLFLNVFTPSLDGARPVLVWIHGGGFFMGSGSSPMYDATALVAAGDVVVVTFNYRLGVLGFLHLDHVLEVLGVTTVDELLAISIEAILEVQASLMIESMADLDARLEADGRPIVLPFQPVVDGVVLPRPPLEEVRNGSARGVPLLIGTTLDESKLFSMMDPTPVDDELLTSRLTSVFGDGEAAAAAYRRSLPDATPRDLFDASITDFIFRQPALRLAEAQVEHQPQVFMYLFTWPTPALGGILGSCHALEMPFVWGNLDLAGMATFLGDAPPQALSERIIAAWIGFARTGDPSHGGLPAWPPFDPARRATMRLDVICDVMDDPEPDRRKLWTTVL